MTRSLVVTTWFPDRAHPSRTPFCLAHVRALHAAGVEVHVVHVELGGTAPITNETYDGVSVTRVSLRPTDPRTWFRTFVAVRRLLATSDVLHTMAFSSVLVAAVPWILRRRPWVHTEHWNGVVNPASVGGWWRRCAFLRHALRLPHAVTGVTHALAQEMERFSRPGATAVVSCVVEPVDHPVAPFPEADPLRLIGIGLLNDRKNPLLAVDTVSWLVSRGLDVTYEWVGEGPLREAARERAETQKLSDRITFTGAIPPASVAARLADAHVFFVPSSQENFFTAAAEAIVAGRLVVLPRSGGFVEYCTPDNSVLVDDQDPASLGSAVLRARDLMRETTPHAVAATIGDNFSHATVGQQFLFVYRKAQR